MKENGKCMVPEAPALGILGNRNGIGNLGLQKRAHCFLFSHEYRFTLRRRLKENISLGDCFLLDYPDQWRTSCLHSFSSSYAWQKALLLSTLWDTHTKLGKGRRHASICSLLPAIPWLAYKVYHYKTYHLSNTSKMCIPKTTGNQN